MKSRSQRILMAMFLCGAMLAGHAWAQIHGVPASATSLGPNGFTGGQSNLPPFIPAGATSLGPAGFAPSASITFHNRSRDFDINDGHIRPNRLGSHSQPFFVPLMYSPLYYGMSYISEEELQSSDRYRAQMQSRGTQGQEPAKLEITIVDKRADVSQSHAASSVAPEQKENEQSAPPVAEEIAAKVLVMRDGTKKEIHSYAILGKNLFDLADGRSRRIPLEEIDADATAKVNEANGVDFKLP